MPSSRIKRLQHWVESLSRISPIFYALPDGGNLIFHMRERKHPANKITIPQNALHLLKVLGVKRHVCRHEGGLLIGLHHFF